MFGEALQKRIGAQSKYLQSTEEVRRLKMHTSATWVLACCHCLLLLPLWQLCLPSSFCAVYQSLPLPFALTTRSISPCLGCCSRDLMCSCSYTTRSCEDNLHKRSCAHVQTFGTDRPFCEFRKGAYDNWHALHLQMKWCAGPDLVASLESHRSVSSCPQRLLISLNLAGLVHSLFQTAAPSLALVLHSHGWVQHLLSYSLIYSLFVKSWRDNAINSCLDKLFPG